MKEVLVRTKPKDSFTLVVSDSSARIQTTFNPPLYLQANRNYELAMVNLGTYYSFANIREGENNSFKWSVDNGKTWTILHVPTASYELKAINAEIIRIRRNSDITILSNVNTLQCILTVIGAKCKVSFDVPNSLASVLGFEQSIYGVGRHASENLVNIMSVNSILVQHYSFFVHATYTSSSCLQFIPKCRSWTKYTRSTRQFNLPPSDCKRHFTFVSVVDGSTREVLGFTWRGIDYTFSSS